MAADDSDERPYKVLGPSKVWMSADARGWAKEHGMSETDFARYLIRQQESDDGFAPVLSAADLPEE
jgi:hypothetical protein